MRQRQDEFETSCPALVLQSLSVFVFDSSLKKCDFNLCYQEVTKHGVLILMQRNLISFIAQF